MAPQRPVLSLFARARNDRCRRHGECARVAGRGGGSNARDTDTGSNPDRERVGVERLERDGRDDLHTPTVLRRDGDRRRREPLGRRVRRENNDGAPIIGVSRYLAPGSYEDVRIRLFEVPGRNFSQSRLEGDRELTAFLHRDSDGDRQFDFVRTDEPLTQNGSVVQNPANVTVVGTAALARTQPTADLSFTAQSAPNGTVTVRSANLSTGGFVVIHRGDGVSGPIIGVSRRLAPGSHEDVQVELFNVSGQEFSRTDLGRSQVLTATAYLDTNNNSRFDYVRTNGSTDFPYLRTGSVVTNPSTINVTNSTTVSS